MNDTRWRDVFAAVDSSVRHFGLAVDLFDNGHLGRGNKEAYRDEMAFMHAMQSGYTSFENALLRTMGVVGEERPVGADWHKQLIERSASDLPELRPAILPTSILPFARRARSFRHWAAHGYDEPFDPEEARRAVEAARFLAEMMRPAIDAFVAAIDPA